MKETKRPTESGRLRKPEPSVNMDELRELISLLRENGLAEFELEREGFRVRLRRGVEYSGEDRRVTASTTAPAAAAAPKTPAAPLAVTSSSAPAHPGALAETAASEDQG